MLERADPHRSANALVARRRTWRQARRLSFAGCLTIALAFLAAAHRTPFEVVGKAEHKWITECSGVAASRKQHGIFWVHNDRGNDPCLFAITAEGKTRGVFRLAAENQDWEDIAADAEGRLYIGDIGNNKDDRRQLQVYRIAEPEVSAEDLPDDQKPAPLLVRADQTWRLKYPADPFDAEALFVDKTHGYVISKLRKHESACLYRFPLDQNALHPVLEKVGELPIADPVTGADLSPDGKQLAVLSDGGLYLFEIDGNPSNATIVKPRVSDVPRDNVEGVCFTDDGSILLTAEKGRIYRMTEPTPAQ